MNLEAQAYLNSIGFKTGEKQLAQPEGEVSSARTKGDQIHRIGSLKRSLNDSVFGQEAAVEAICDQMVKQSWDMGKRGPAGVFLFVGPSGTGKSFLANRLTLLLGEDWALHTIDMSALTGENQSSELDGTEPSYSNAGPGRLTSFVRLHPRTVVVFDDIDQTNPIIANRLISLLDTGIMRDRFGFYEDNNPKNKRIAPSEVDFRECILIFTTRAGAQAYEDPAFALQIKKNPYQASKMLQQELAGLEASLGNLPAGTKQFSAPLLNHWETGGLIFFRPLGLNELSRIAREVMTAGFAELGSLFQEGFHFNDLGTLSRMLVLSMAPNVDARRVAREGMKLLFDPVTDHLMESAARPKMVSLQASDALRDFLDADALAKQFGGREALTECARRNLKLTYETRLRDEGETLFVEFDLPRLQRVPHAQDIRGAGAVRVEVPAISFGKIAGHHVAKGRLNEVVRLLKAPETLSQLDVGIPKGMMLYGPPGTGKTLLAKALAHEADLPFISTTGSEILNLDFLKTIFQRARKYAPSLLFIDEIDVVGRRDRGGYDVVINQLLIEIDGFETSLSEPVFLVVATNLPGKIDPAIIRSGRIDLHIEIPELDRDARSYFVDRYLELPNDGSLDRDVLLANTAGMSGADLEKIRREVALDMVRRGHSAISQTGLLELINTMKYGDRSKSPHHQQQQEHVAIHEAGHAVVSAVVNPEVIIEQITIVARDNADGFVSFDREQVDTRRRTRQEVIDDICTALAGRLAQEKRFPGDGADNGASSDLQNATRLAYLAVAEWGLDPEFCVMSLKGLPEDPAIQAIAAQQMFPRIQLLLDEAKMQCRAIIDEHWSKIEAVTTYLQRESTMDGRMLRDLMSNPPGSPCLGSN